MDATGADKNIACKAGSDSLFVGRSEQLAQLLDALQFASCGHGKLLCMVGEPGIGKTRLAAEFAGRARKEGAQIGWASAVRLLGTPAPNYWLWMQLLRDCLLPTDASEAYARQLPDSLDRNGAAPASELFKSHQQDNTTPSFRLFDATVKQLAEISQRGPLVLVLDDIARADPLSLLALGFIASRLSQHPVLIIATCREAEARRSEPISEVLRAGSCGSGIVTLPVLSSREVESLIRAQSRGQSSEPEFAHKVTTLARGNPRFVELLLHDRAWLTYDSEPRGLHDELRSAAEQHLELLSARSRQVLEAAAVLGLGFDLSTLENTANVAARELLDAMSEARRLGIVEENGGGRYTFGHPLVRHTLYESISDSDRALLHNRVAQYLQKSFGCGRERLEDIARHLHAAIPIGNRQDSADYCERAGERLGEAGQFGQAARFFDMAITALPSNSNAGARRCELLLKLADARRAAGEQDAAQEALRQAAELAKLLNDDQLFAQTALRCAGNSASSGTDPNWEIVSVLRQAIELKIQNRSLRVRLLLRLAAELHGSVDMAAECHQLEREANKIARSVKNTDVAREILIHRQLFRMHAPNEIDQQISECEELLRISNHPRDSSEERLTAVAICMAANLRKGIVFDPKSIEGNPDAFDPPAGRVMQKEHLLHVVSGALLDGRFRHAAKLIWRALEPPDRVFVAEEADWLWPALVVPFRELGKLGELDLRALKTVERYPTVPIFRILRGHVLYGCGHANEASEQFDRVGDWGLKNLPRDFALVPSLTNLAELGVDLNKQHRIPELYELLLPWDGLNSVLGPLAFFGPVSMYLGMLSSCQGDYERAELHFEAAMSACEKMGSRPWQAYVRYYHARALAGCRNSCAANKAHRLASEALAITAELGMSSLASRISQLPTATIIEPSDQDSKHESACDPAEQGPDWSEIPKTKPGIAETKHQSDATSSTLPENSIQQGTFVQEGEYWTILYEEKLLRLKHTKGLACIANLLRHPGEEFHSSDLAAILDGIRVESIGRQAARLGGDELGARQPRRHDSGPVLDDNAKRSYRNRLRELREEAEDAKAFNDFGRVSRIDAEISFVARELTGAMGLGGKGEKRLDSEAERSRISVTNVVRAAVQKIRREHPPLGRYLALTIRTGRFCSFRPDSRYPCIWRV